MIPLVHWYMEQVLYPIFFTCPIFSHLRDVAAKAPLIFTELEIVEKEFGIGGGELRIMHNDEFLNGCVFWCMLLITSVGVVQSLLGVLLNALLHILLNVLLVVLLITCMGVVQSFLVS